MRECTATKLQLTIRQLTLVQSHKWLDERNNVNTTMCYYELFKITNTS